LNSSQRLLSSPLLQWLSNGEATPLLSPKKLKADPEQENPPSFFFLFLQIEDAQPPLFLTFSGHGAWERWNCLFQEILHGFPPYGWEG